MVFEEMEDSSACNVESTTSSSHNPLGSSNNSNEIGGSTSSFGMITNNFSSSSSSLFQQQLQNLHYQQQQQNNEIVDFESKQDGNQSGGGGVAGVGSGSSNYKKPTQDSDDSSYDSDCEVSDGTAHYDVSRTVSDTLGQEFAEYITLGESNEATDALTSPVRFTFESDPGYGSRVEFAMKLGYTETQVRIALSKLGASPSQDELLSELILLDSSNTSNIGETEDDNETAAALPQRSEAASLRHIVIDGSNVAMSHGNNKVFSCRGIKLAVEYFKSRGHKDITVFLPSYRKDNVSEADKAILRSLENERSLVYTPSKILDNKRVTCYDDRYILDLAGDVDGIVVSNDNYRDLARESARFRPIVEHKLLMYSFVNDRFMPPEDPLGRNGPSLDQFLSKALIRKTNPCPYKKKCTFGSKCKYYHSTQQPSVSDTLRKQAAMKTQSVPITRANLMPISRTKSAVVPMESGRNEGSQLLGANPHKKLQRQLSINPGGDPRISQAWRTGSSTSNISVDPFTSHRNTTYLHPFPGNPLLSEVWSPPELMTPTTTIQQQQQQQASPASSPELLSVPTLNIFGPPGSSSTSGQQSNRTKMYHHLSAIFPEEQVREVMNMHPEETDARVICGVIVNKFK